MDWIISHKIMKDKWMLTRHQWLQRGFVRWLEPGEQSLSSAFTLNKPVNGHTRRLEEHGGVGAKLLGHVDTRFPWHALSPLPLFIYGWM